MDLNEFDFPFEPALVADRPSEPRDHARLFVLTRTGGDHAHRHITDLPSLLCEGDLVVLNDTKVLAARIIGRKRSSGGRVALLFVKPLDGRLWEVMVKGRMQVGQVIDLGCECEATVVERNTSRTTVCVEGPYSVPELMTKVGHMPLPPYIKRPPCESDHRWYQTVFANMEGAIAAPTAGLHISEMLLEELGRKGIQVAYVTLHVGPGTFLPVKKEQVHQHRMESERFEVPRSTAEAVLKTKAQSGRVVAVGTTVVRCLEGAADWAGMVQPVRGETELFVVPGYRFRIVDALLTNFHLPRTTLLMLVSAFAGTERLRAVYGEAIKERYRFYSYGDAMLIL